MAKQQRLDPEKVEVYYVKTDKATRPLKFSEIVFRGSARVLQLLPRPFLRHRSLLQGVRGRSDAPAPTRATPASTILGRQGPRSLARHKPVLQGGRGRSGLSDSRAHSCRTSQLCRTGGGSAHSDAHAHSRDTSQYCWAGEGAAPSATPVPIRAAPARGIAIAASRRLMIAGVFTQSVAAVNVAA